MKLALILALFLTRPDVGLEKVRTIRGEGEKWTTEYLQEADSILNSINIKEATSEELAQIYEYKAMIARLSGQWQLAAEYLTKCLLEAERSENDQRIFQGRISLALVLSKLGLTEEALNVIGPAYDHYNDSNPYKRHRLLYNIGLIHFRNNDYKEALEYFSLSKSHGNSNLDHYQFIGLCYLENNQLEDAKNEFNRLLYIENSNKLWTNFNLAFTYKEMGRVDKAEEYFIRSLEIDSMDFNSLMEYGELLVNSNRLEKGLELLLLAEGLYDDQPAHADNLKVYEVLARMDPAYFESFVVESKMINKTHTENSEEQEKLNARIMLLRSEASVRNAADAEKRFYFGFGLLALLIIVVGIAISLLGKARLQKEMEEKEFEQAKTKEALDIINNRIS